MDSTPTSCSAGFRLSLPVVVCFWIQVSVELPAVVVHVVRPSCVRSSSMAGVGNFLFRTRRGTSDVEFDGRLFRTFNAIRVHNS